MSWHEKPSWLRSQNSEKPRIFQVTGANQNARKLLFTDWVNTKSWYTYLLSFNRSLLISKAISPFWTSSNFMAAVSNISTSIISNTAGFPYLQQRKTICVRSEQLEKQWNMSKQGTLGALWAVTLYMWFGSVGFSNIVGVNTGIPNSLSQRLLKIITSCNVASVMN